MSESEQGAMCPLTYTLRYSPEVAQIALANMRHSLTLGYPSVREKKANGKTLVIVGCAPSVKGYLERLKALRRNPAYEIWCVNDAHNWLLDNDIVPDVCALYEIHPDPRTVYKRPDERVKYYVCSQCDAGAFEDLKGFSITLWHCLSEVGEEKIVGELDPDSPLIAGGSTTLMRCINMGYVQGFRDFELYGADSSYKEETHIHGTPSYVKPNLIECAMTFGSETHHYKTARYLLRQADEFRQFTMNFHHLFSMRVMGDGLLPTMHRAMFPTSYTGEANV